ncbi:hypothetical protein SKAU_G00105430 [Synaphobranchus kaupii]|uniref:DNA topoisomerase n=1 Tax=Synaphobranchus kaupii TaxID=118154 RepID=A0A9Q1J5P3_SYNKA|nr:hypothetical protein SKAU_G00105430 [Synaphobranchus kaupii]
METQKNEMGFNKMNKKEKEAEHWKEMKDKKQKAGLQEIDKEKQEAGLFKMIQEKQEVGVKNEMVINGQSKELRIKKKSKTDKLKEQPKEGKDWRVSLKKKPDEEIEPVMPLKFMKEEEGKPAMEMGNQRGAEEVAFFYAQMLDHEYTTKEVFRNNVLKDWRREMTPEERTLITDLNKCDFWDLFYEKKLRVEGQHNMSKEKQTIKEANERLMEEYGYCTLDQHRERIGNFRIEPPGLFCGRGEHPKQGMLKRRIQPEDVIINCSKQSRIPEPPAGHKWKEVRHDNTVTWLASWTENIQGSCKYSMLNPTTHSKGEDWEKYEVARRLNSCVDQIQSQYCQDMNSKEMLTRQRATALYFIDKQLPQLALRVGNEKEADETADTVGCCSLRVEHITLHRQLDTNKYVVEFDFLGKDSIRYYNKVPVIKRPDLVQWYHCVVELVQMPLQRTYVQFCVPIEVIFQQGLVYE